MNGSSAPRGSIVIPAHNEHGAIGRLLEGFDVGGVVADYRVVVVANGCTDDTADIARSFTGVEVVETPIGSKAGALNLGDDHAGDLFPRAYVDADVVLDPLAIRATFAALDEPDVYASAPFAVYDRVQCSRVARRYVRVLEGLPVFRGGLQGSGCYAMSRDGRGRFGRFPDLVGDDRFVDALFAPGEKRSVNAHPVTVFGPRTLRAVVRRGVRVKTGSLAADRAGAQSAAVDNRAHLRRLARRPSSWPDLAVFVGAHAAVVAWARWNQWRGRDVGWTRDDSRG